MNTPIIIANWKSNPDNMRSALRLIENTEHLLNKNKYKYYIAAPETMIYQLREYDIVGVIGAQNFANIEGGAHTGESRLSHILDAGAQFVILGHSEARARGEKEEYIAAKVTAALAADLRVVLCIGEKERDTEGKYLEEIARQVRVGISLLDKDRLNKLVIAYEPVWAVGAPAPATPAESLEAAITIRRELAAIVGLHNAKQTQIIYGGSAHAGNAHHFIAEGGMDGVLIGRDCLVAEDFAQIINSCYEL